MQYPFNVHFLFWICRRITSPITLSCLLNTVLLPYFIFPGSTQDSSSTWKVFSLSHLLRIDFSSIIPALYVYIVSLVLQWPACWQSLLLVYEFFNDEVLPVYHQITQWLAWYFAHVQAINFWLLNENLFTLYRNAIKTKRIKASCQILTFVLL